MGMDRAVTFASAQLPRWAAVRDLLTRHGYPVQMRMINGELAFPDEEPAEPWQELRVATANGMVTLRREQDSVRLVVWGNADPALAREWNALAWAFAEAGGGQVMDAAGPLSAAAFRQAANLVLSPDHQPPSP